MPAPPAPPQGPAFGPAAPTYQTIISEVAKAAGHAFGAMPHANGGKFNWHEIGEAVKQAAKAGPAAVGPAVMDSAKAAGWSTVGQAIAKSFGREIHAAGGLLAIEGGLGRFAENVNEANRRLIPFSGKVASAFAQLDYGDTRRSFRVADATGDSAANLAKAVDRMRDAFVPGEILQANINNRLGIFGSEIGRISGNVLGMGANLLNQGIEAIDPGGSTSALVGRATAITSWGYAGFALGNAIFPGLGGAAGAAAGLAVGFAADAMTAPAGDDDPWGDFLVNAGSVPVLRPPKNLIDFGFNKFVR